MKKYSDENIDCYFSTNENGYSKNNYSSLNLAFQVMDEQKDVLKNREKYFSNIDTYDKSIFCHQTHSDIFVEATAKMKNKGLNSFSDGVNCDALYTFEKNLSLNAYFADCTPIYFYSKKDNLVGIIHAGWQGTVKEITGKTLENILVNHNVDPKDIRVIIGPSIGVESFAVDEDVVIEVKKTRDYTDCIFQKGDKFFVDVKRLNYLQAKNLGIDNIMVSDIDTVKDKSYFSYRRDGVTGRMVGSIINRSENE